MTEQLAKMVPHFVSETEVKDEGRFYMVESKRKLPLTEKAKRVDH